MMTREALRVIVTGSRDWRKGSVIGIELAQLPEGSTIVQGCASGADAIARSLALGLGFDVEDHWPDYVNLSFAEANKARNQEMVDLGADLVLAFPTKRSRGTWDCVTRAGRANLQVKIVNEDGTFRYVPDLP